MKKRMTNQQNDSLFERFYHSFKYSFGEAELFEALWYFNRCIKKLSFLQSDVDYSDQIVYAALFTREELLDEEEFDKLKEMYFFLTFNLGMRIANNLAYIKQCDVDDIPDLYSPIEMYYYPNIEVLCSTLYECIKDIKTEYRKNRAEKYILIILLIWNGINANEIRKLRKSQFNFKNNTVTLSKGGPVAVDGITMELLFNYCKNNKPQNLLFYAVPLDGDEIINTFIAICSKYVTADIIRLNYMSIKESGLFYRNIPTPIELDFGIEDLFVRFLIWNNLFHDNKKNYKKTNGIWILSNE